MGVKHKIASILAFSFLMISAYGQIELFKDNSQKPLFKLDVDRSEEKDKTEEATEQKAGTEGKETDSKSKEDTGSQEATEKKVEPVVEIKKKEAEKSKSPEIKKPSKQQDKPVVLEKASSSEDRLIFEVAHSNWYSDPAIPNLSKRWFSRAFNAYYMHDFDLNGKRNVSFAPGIGLGTNIIAYDNSLFTDSAGITQFRLIPDSINYTRNNFVTAYFDIPLELRFRTNPDKNGNRWKLALGLKGGYLFNSHTKYVGDDLVIPDETNTKVKTYRLKNISNVRYGYTVRIGYGNYNLIGYYNANTLFQKDRGPGIHPWYIGISLNSL